MKQRYMDFVPTASRQTGQVASHRRTVTATEVTPVKRTAGRVISTKNEPVAVNPRTTNTTGAVARTTSVARPTGAVRATSGTRAVNSVATRETKTIKPAGAKVKATTRPVAARVTRPQTAVRPAEAAEGVSPKKKEEKPEKKEKTEEKPKGLKRFSLRRSEKKAEKKSKQAEVEDFSKRFVNTNVPKRPLARATGTRQVAANQAKQAGAPGVAKATSQPKQIMRPGSRSVTGASRTTAVSTTRRGNFVYPQKIEKRPLSNTNIYGKKPMVTKPMSKEEPKGPVTIISKPDKQSHVGIIVAVILTIILGAAAGTVAFLILPK